MADQDRDPTLAQNDDATPQDQFKPAESHFGQNSPSKLTPIEEGAEGQGQNSALQNATGNAAAGYGQTGFSGDMGGSGQIAGNDTPGGGLGQNQQSYGQSGDTAPQAADQADVTQHDAQQQASAGIGARTGNLGASPTGGASQPSSPTTGGPDLSKGLSDQNRNGL